MPACAYVVDGYYNDVWVLSDFDNKTDAPLYKRADAVTGDDEIIGKLPRPWTETQIEDVYGIRDRGPEVVAVHPPSQVREAARIAEYERTHPFVNAP